MEGAQASTDASSDAPTAQGASPTAPGRRTLGARHSLPHRHSGFERQLGLAACLILTFFSAIKGMAPALSLFGLAHFQITYAHGPVRRGLLGTLFQLAFGRRPWDEQAALVLMVSHAAVLAFVVAMGIGVALAYRRRSFDGRFLLLALPLLASQAWPTLAYDVGFADVWVIALIALSLLAVRRERFWLTACLGVLAAFIHEYTAVVWLLPVAAQRLGARGRAITARWIAGVAPIAAALFLVLVPGIDQLRSAIWDIDAPLALKQTIFEQWSPGILEHVTMMVHMHLTYWRSDAFAVVYFSLPAVVCAYIYARHYAHDSRASHILLGCALLAPAGLLLFGWDLSRFASLPNVMVLLAILTLELNGPGRSSEMGRGVAAVLILMTLTELAKPFAYTYFNRGTVAEFAPNLRPLAAGLLSIAGSTLHLTAM